MLEDHSMYGLTDPRNNAISYIGSTTRPLEIRLSEHINEALTYWKKISESHLLKFVQDKNSWLDDFYKKLEAEHGIKRYALSRTNEELAILQTAYKATGMPHFLDESDLRHNWLYKHGWIAFLSETTGMLPGIVLLDTVTSTRTEALLIEFRYICDYIQRGCTLYNKVTRNITLTDAIHKKKRSVMDNKEWERCRDKFIAMLNQPLADII